MIHGWESAPPVVSVVGEASMCSMYTLTLRTLASAGGASVRRTSVCTTDDPGAVGPRSERHDQAISSQAANVASL